MPIVRRLIPILAFLAVRVLAWTLRFRFQDRCGITSGEMKSPIICVFWHNRLLLTGIIHGRFCPGRRAHCLTSPSKDGDIIAHTMRLFGIGSVRGSSSRRGSTAIRELAAILEKGDDVGIAPDGPRGPKYRLQPGAVKLAQITGFPVVPLFIEYSRYWELKSWDGFRIPKPFSCVSVVYGSRHEVCPTMDDAGFEYERVRLEKILAGGGEGA